jgi:hypothetical protein
MGGTGQMNSPLHMQERRASFFDEEPPGVGEFHTDNAPIVPNKQANSMLFFDLSDLSAKRRLAEVQSMGGPREIQLFAQDNDCV